MGIVANIIISAILIEDNALIYLIKVTHLAWEQMAYNKMGSEFP